MKLKSYWIAALLSLLLPLKALAFEPFVIEDIEVEGLQRISPGSVFNDLPLKPGDLMDEEASNDAIRALFRSAQYENVVLERRGNTLIVFVEERPTISEIEVRGSEMFSRDEFLLGLEQLGFAKGRVFNRAILDKVEQSLRGQYLGQGKYGVRMEITVTPQQLNRVAIDIAIDEGEVATIRKINIVGNQVFDDEQLLKLFELGPAPDLSFFYSDDQYSKQRLMADIERLRSFYFDRGYLRFEVTSSQVTLSPDKREVYITVNIDEGAQYRVSRIKLAGNLLLPEDELLGLLLLAEGDVYSRSLEQATVTAMTERYGAEGYAMARVNVQHEVDEERKEVAMTLHIDHGSRSYIRRINVYGNYKTNDEVVRRELRQMEGGVQVPANVNRSKVRLDRLGFFDNVQIEPQGVPGQGGMTDLNIKVAERETFGSFNLGAGYDGENGVVLQTSVTQENFLGTGKYLSLELNNSQSSTVYSLNYTNPYYTLDGISRNLTAFNRKTDTSSVSSLANYYTDSWGGGVRYGIPITEHDTFRFGANYENIRVHTISDSAQTMQDFCAENASLTQCEFSSIKPYLSWSHDTRNRAYFPTAGSQVSFSTTVATPAGEGGLRFYTSTLSGKKYLPVYKELIFAADLELSYGDGYGDTTSLPPFERFYAGGITSVRGYSASSLGPRDIDGDVTGGNARVTGSLELIFPPPFDDSQSMRAGLFIDAGNVYDTRAGSIDYGELRYSAGIAFNWFTPVGPLVFSLARPLNDEPSDDLETFQFTIGTGF